MWLRNVGGAGAQGFVGIIGDSSSSTAYSRVDIRNSDGQAPPAARTATVPAEHFSITPARNVMMDGEFQWAHCNNFSGGFSVKDLRA